MYPVNLAVLLCTVISYISGAKISKRIIGGYNAKEGHYPWAVSIKGVHPKSRSITFCGSTIVTDQWLLSAAHCFWTDPKQKTHLMDPANWQAQAGNTQIELAPEKPGDSLVGKLMDNSPVHSFSDFLDALLEFFRG
ncbi:unnamed protein product [Dicrocoelium dendriticum]|nr:unnamed protein product [Dicrocoelium dendriticum]